MIVRGWIRRTLPLVRAHRRLLIALSLAALVLPPAGLTGCSLVCGYVYRSDWPAPVEHHRVITSDGWTLDLKRVPPSGERRHPRPVITQHGIVTNGRNVDFDEQRSLARYLSSRGFDVWVPSLRGTGESEKPSLFGRAGDHDFDTFVTEDLAAILAYVKKESGSEVVDYVGHSMGGMMLYAHLARGGDDIGRAVTIGSPVRFHLSGRVERLLRSVVGLAGYAAWFPLRRGAHLSLPVHGGWQGPVERLLISPENTDVTVWRSFIAVGMDDVSRPLLEQFGGWIADDVFASRNREIDYFAGLSNVRTPILVMAGKIDGIAPPWMVRPAFDRLGSEEKRWLVVGEGNGMSADYNHMDLLLGERAGDDVFAHVAAFLAHDRLASR